MAAAPAPRTTEYNLAAAHAEVDRWFRERRVGTLTVEFSEQGPRAIEGGGGRISLPTEPWAEWRSPCCLAAFDDEDYGARLRCRECGTWYSFWFLKKQRCSTGSPARAR